MHGLKVLGLWLLYAVTGLVVAAAAAATSTDLHLDSDAHSRTHLRTKLAGGLSGLLLALGALGLFLLNDPAAGAPALARTLALLGGSGGALLALGALWMIDRDLRAGRAHRRTAGRG